MKDQVEWLLVLKFEVATGGMVPFGAVVTFNDIMTIGSDETVIVEDACSIKVDSNGAPADNNASFYR